MKPHNSKLAAKFLRRTIFFILINTALFLGGFLVWLELILPMNLPLWLTNAFVIFSAFSFAMVVLFLLRIHVRKPSSARVFLTFGLAGLFIHLLCTTIIKEAIIWIPGFSPYEAQICRVFGLMAIILNFLGIHGALRGPLVTRVRLIAPPHLKELRGFKIAQISDLHIGPMIRRRYVTKVVNRIQLLKANLIVLTGDIGDSDPAFYGTEAKPLRELSAPEGVFYITGNHEYYWDAHKWIRIFNKVGMHALVNEGVSIAGGKIWLGGIADPDAGDFIPEHHPDAEKALAGNLNKETFKILLAHQPKSCFDAEKAGFDLMLSGHTHGGQFFPFNYVVAVVNPYSKGLNQHGKMQVYVNRGTGFWGPPLRLGVNAEITLFEFV